MSRYYLRHAELCVLIFKLVFAKLEYMELDIAKIKKNIPRAAKLLRVLANEQRLKILCQLLEGEQCVGELWQRSDLSQSAFSQHLSKLRTDKIVKTRKEAQTVYYRLESDAASNVLEALYNIYCE